MHPFLSALLTYIVLVLQSVGSTVTSSSSDASSDEDRPQVSKPRKNMVVISSDEEDYSGSDSEVEVASTR